MITVQEMMAATSLPEIQALTFDAFSARDVVNLIMQRSEIIHDQPRSGRVIKAWSNGDPAPAFALVDQYGDELARRAAAIILLEYRQIQPSLDRVSPRRVADIGCGYAMFDLFLWRDHRCQLLLIDLEDSENRQFGFAEKGAAYSNLAVAKAFLVDNGVSPEDIDCRNPKTTDFADAEPVDLALSFISCGFHYPVHTYSDFFLNKVTETGAIILDLRTRTAEKGKAELDKLGSTSFLVQAANGNAHRVMVQKH